MTYSQFTLPGRAPFGLLMAPSPGLRWLAWALFGNLDDGPTGPADFEPGRPAWLRAMLWWLRNPFHNLTFYVLGVTHLDQIRAGRFPLSVFAQGGGFNWAISYTRRDKTDFIRDLTGVAIWLIGLAILPFGWRWAVITPLGLCYLLHAFRSAGWMPFVSWRGSRIDAYIGWRERGNFGIKLNLKRAR